MAGTYGRLVDAVVGVDGKEKPTWSGSFVVRSAKASLDLQEELCEQFPREDWKRGCMAVQLKRGKLGEKKIAGDRSDKARAVMGWKLVVGEEEVRLLQVLEQKQFDWGRFAEKIGVEKVEVMDFGRAAEIIVGHIAEGGAGYKDQQQYEQEQDERSRKQVIVFHFDNADPDRGKIREKAEEAIGKEMADEGEAEDPVKGAEIAKREGQVEDVFIGTQNSNGKPFAVITCKGNKDAERLLYAHSCGGGALRGVLGKWARFVAGEPRHQREARRKVKEGMRPGVRGGGEGGGGGWGRG